jgi:murein DD-endopeptidase MepM/ murein hydrolase activator NlpD
MQIFSSLITASLMGGFLFGITACGPARDQGDASTLPSAASDQAALPAASPVSNNDNTVVLVSTAVLTPSPEPSATPTPLAPPMPIPTPAGPPYTYHTVSEGESLSYISMQYDTPLEDLVRMNNLAGPEAIIQVGQSLRVPLHTENVAPTQMLLPDSEVVYSPAYLDFDTAAFIRQQGGYLAGYSQWVDNGQMTGPEIVELVAQQFSVGPRLLLALLEHYGQWVTNPAPAAGLIDQPLGLRNPYGGDLYRALGFTANRVNAGYYGYKRDGFWVFELYDRSRAVTPQGLNAGTVGLQNILAVHAGWDTWQQELSPTGFMDTYRRLFGDPFAHTFEPIVPATLAQPPLTLPWAKGGRFYLTGGPHPAFADGSAWAAVDFGPPDVLGNCFYSATPNTAAADGVIALARAGEVLLDLDGDGYAQTGWVLLYLHTALDADQPVQVGQAVRAGDVIGYASCEGGLANSSHLHLARRYNGEWLDAAGPVPFNLGGWVFQPTLVPYFGAIVNNGETREACECWDDALNLVVNPAE